MIEVKSCHLDGHDKKTCLLICACKCTNIFQSMHNLKHHDLFASAESDNERKTNQKSKKHCHRQSTNHLDDMCSVSHLQSFIHHCLCQDLGLLPGAASCMISNGTTALLPQKKLSKEKQIARQKAVQPLIQQPFEHDR